MRSGSKGEVHYVSLMRNGFDVIWILSYDLWGIGGKGRCNLDEARGTVPHQ